MMMIKISLISLYILFTFGVIISYKKHKFSYVDYLYNHYNPINIRLVIFDVLISMICFGIIKFLQIENSLIVTELVKALILLALFVSLKSFSYLFAKIIFK